jgi:hypothetical protein
VKGAGRRARSQLLGAQQLDGHHPDAEVGVEQPLRQRQQRVAAPTTSHGEGDRAEEAAHAQAEGVGRAPCAGPPANQSSTSTSEIAPLTSAQPIRPVVICCGSTSGWASR